MQSKRWELMYLTTLSQKISYATFWKVTILLDRNFTYYAKERHTKFLQIRASKYLGFYFTSFNNIIKILYITIFQKQVYTFCARMCNVYPYARWPCMFGEIARTQTFGLLSGAYKCLILLNRCMKPKLSQESL